MPHERVTGRDAVARDDLEHARRDDLLGELEKRSSVSGVCSAGLMIWTLPAASAGQIFQIAMYSG